MNFGNPRISLEEILSSGTERVSDPLAFGRFAAGLRLTPDLLVDDRWQVMAPASSLRAFFDVTLHEIMPAYYDVRHLEGLDGLFSLRVREVGDYTFTALNRRVITFAGLRLDTATDGPALDAEILPGVFMGWCTDLLASLAERTLVELEATAHSDGVAVYRP